MEVAERKEKSQQEMEDDGKITVKLFTVMICLDNFQAGGIDEMAKIWRDERRIRIRISFMK